MRKRVRRPKPSTLPWAGGSSVMVDFDDMSRALKVHPKQAKKANEEARKMGCGEPFRKDGMFIGGRRNKARYMRELNKRREDRGQDRMVNYDGGYGDVT